MKALPAVSMVVSVLKLISHKRTHCNFLLYVIVLPLPSKSGYIFPQWNLQDKFCTFHMHRTVVFSKSSILEFLRWNCQKCWLIFKFSVLSVGQCPISYHYLDHCVVGILCIFFLFSSFNCIQQQSFCVLSWKFKILSWKCRKILWKCCGHPVLPLSFINDPFPFFYIPPFQK